MSTVKKAIITDAGFADAFFLPDSERETRRRAHNLAKAERIIENETLIIEQSNLILRHMVDGKDINVEKIDPILIEVKPGTKWETIFRWWNLVWWSLPYERPFGRQFRYLVWDKHHNAPIGLIGLQSPILNWGVRDSYLGITAKDRDYWVNQSLNAQRLGALPPYNNLLGGKLVASMMTTDTIRKAFHRKYCNKETEMMGRILPPNLLFITTTGAYGKSSVYSRLKMNGVEIAKFVGYTKGVGSFHIPNFLYEDLLDFLRFKKINTQRGSGTGPSRKIRLIQEALQLLGFRDGINHSVKRSLYIFPFVSNLEEVIQSNRKPKWIRRGVSRVSEFWRVRWAIPRSLSDKKYLEFDKIKFVDDALREVDECSRIFKTHQK